MSAESFVTLEQVRRRIAPVVHSNDGTMGTPFQRLVLLDDFAGTGWSLIEGLKSSAETLKMVERAGVGIVLIVVAGFDLAYERVVACVDEMDLNVVVHFCDQFGEEHMAFAKGSGTFGSDDERREARNMAESFGLRLEQKHPLGFGGTEALVAFYESCPNNTLPILWSNDNKWRPLFPRH